MDADLRSGFRAAALAAMADIILRPLAWGISLGLLLLKSGHTVDMANPVISFVNAFGGSAATPDMLQTIFEVTRAGAFLNPEAMRNPAYWGIVIGSIIPTALTGLCLGAFSRVHPLKRALLFGSMATAIHIAGIPFLAGWLGVNQPRTVIQFLVVKLFFVPVALVSSMIGFKLTHGRPGHTG